MPVIEVSLPDEIIEKNDLSKDPATLFAESAEVNRSDVTIMLKKISAMFGNQYAAIVHLYIPDLWSSEKIEKMLLAINQTIETVWKIHQKEIMVMTHLIESNQVSDRGEIISW